MQYVYELCQCEEYWMQESCGLFDSPEAAIQAVDQTILLEAHHKWHDGSDLPLLVTDDSYLHSPASTIPIHVGGDNPPIATPQDLLDFLYGNGPRGCKFYDIIHYSYGLYGVYRREVKTLKTD